MNGGHGRPRPWLKFTHPPLKPVTSICITTPEHVQTRSCFAASSQHHRLCSGIVQLDLTLGTPGGITTCTCRINYPEFNPG